MDEIKIQDVADEKLLEDYHRSLDRIKIWQDLAGRAEQEIRRRMEERGATGIPSDDFICEVKTINGYQPEVLAPLKEIFKDADLANCWTPEHEETVTVPEKWDARKFLPLAKRYGDLAQVIVDEARYIRTQTLTFGPRLSSKS